MDLLSCMHMFSISSHIRSHYYKLIQSLEHPVG